MIRMLYKKIHRQYVREFREGREIKNKYDNIYKIGKPRIDYPSLRFNQYLAIIVRIDDIDYSLIYIKGPEKGIIRCKSRLAWVDAI